MHLQLTLDKCAVLVLQGSCGVWLWSVSNHTLNISIHDHKSAVSAVDVLDIVAKLLTYSCAVIFGRCLL